MNSKKQKLDGLIQFFVKSYKLTSVDRASLNEKTIVNFRGYQLLIYCVYLFFLLLILSFFLVGYGPLNNLLPQTALNKKNQIIDLVLKVDSLEKDLLLRGQYINVVHSILRGEVIDSVTPLLKDSSMVFNTLSLPPSRADSLLREMVEKEDLYNIPLKKKMGAEVLQDFIFFKPVDGVITSKFNPAEKHYGVDVVTHTGASVKSCLDGVVVFADWSMSGGNMLFIQHADNIISVYMHNSVLTKKSNNLVRAGEVVGVVGNSGELSSGPHLHFELWQNGVPINPLEYIDF